MDGEISRETFLDMLETLDVEVTEGRIVGDITRPLTRKGAERIWDRIIATQMRVISKAT